MKGGWIPCLNKELISVQASQNQDVIRIYYYQPQRSSFMSKAITITLTLLLQVFTNNIYAEQKALITRHDGSSIDYYLKENSGETLLVLLQGSDCNSVVHNKTINETFSEVIPGADILTIDKYGVSESLHWNPSGDSVGCPKSYFTYDSPKQRTNDYLQVIDELRNNSGYRNIVLLGGSEGALVAAMVAAKNNYITAVVSLNGGGRFFIDDILYSMSHELPPQALEEAQKGIREFHTVISNSDDMEVQMSGHGFQWWKSMLTLDQAEILMKVQAPLLVIQAELDKSVSPILAAKQAELISQKKNNFEYLPFEGIDHKFKDSKGKSHASEVINSIQEWLKKLERKGDLHF